MKDLKDISQRAKSWDNTITLSGVWIEHDNATITLHAKTLKGIPVEANLTLAQAKALQTLLSVAIEQLKGVSHDIS